ncbi:putative uncharacterized protein DDB_G0282133 isoform X2 [Harmonia axyridis]|uniref:putative uncharacterized protein DDB_G0282133 isoform X2 n=1 Tax=Harmonia axyridis TaxID=115357 RepID=UPI001E27834F|nr:putative uncharacterized protein DDB_G0282133 isoform X2 [Harmonia axyridis]
MSQTKSLRKRKALIPNEISVAIKTPKSKQYLFTEGTTSSNTKESEYEDEYEQVKKSKKKKLRRTQNCSPFINSSKNKSNSRDSNNEKRKMSSSNNSDVEVICESKEKLKSKKKKKFKLPLVNLNDLEVFDELSENSRRDESCRKKDSPMDIIGRILQVEEVASSKGGKSKSKKKKFEVPLMNLEDLEVMDGKAQSKKNISFDSLSSEIEVNEPISRNSTDVKRRLRSSNNSNIEVICEPNEKAKSKKKKKVKLPVRSLDLEVRDNLPEGKENDSPIDSIDCLSQEIDSSKREKSKSKKKKADVKAKQKTSLEKNILFDSQSNKLEAKEDINVRKNNKKRKTSQREENSKCSDQTGESDGNDKNSSISKRSSKRSTVLNSRCSDKAEESEESIKILSVKRTNKTKNSKSNDISEKTEENINISRVSERSSKIGNSRFTDQFEEANEGSSVDKPLTRKNSRISNSKCTDPTGVPVRFSSSFKSNLEEVRNSTNEDQTSNLCSDHSNKPEQNVINNENAEGIISINECCNSINVVDCDKSGQNEIRSRNNSFKLSFENGIVMSNQKKRKRWTIDPLNTVEVKNDIKKMSLSVNLGNKRVARKRWSTELKKKLAESNNYSIIEINESVTTNEISKNGHSKNLSSSSTSRKSNVSNREVAASILDSPLPNNTNLRDDTIGKTQQTSKDEILTSDSNTTKHKDNSQELSLRRSKRYSKSLDGISVLEETIKLESTGGAMLENDSRNSGNRNLKTPCSILKRRGTYDLDVSVTDVSVLRSLSESNLSNNESKDDRKKVKFQHVNIRKKCDGPLTKKSESQVASAKKLPSILTAANKSVSFDQTMFSAVSCPTSTPLHSSKMNSLLKKTLTKENLGTISNKKRSVEEEKNKVVRRIRMPNFTKIHQERMNRMEDISQMAERKAERAKLLLSGLKPASQSTSINNKTPKQVDKEQPKQIKFTRNNQLASTSAKIVTANSNIKHKENESNLKLQEKSKNTIRFGLIGKSGIPRKPPILKTKTTQIDDILKKSEQIKSIATKSKPQRDTREDRRTILKGVRGNRRFDLLMKMRNK